MCSLRRFTRAGFVKDLLWEPQRSTRMRGMDGAVQTAAASIRESVVS